MHGAPRSGTTWLGQIFNACSRVAYKYQPLFSYRFKDRINLHSSQSDLFGFLDELYATMDDEFISGNWPKPELPQTDIYKVSHPDVMVMKEVRYHHLIEFFIKNIPDIKIVGIVRNPCAVINSWLRAPREFDPSWDVMTEWRYAPLKNQSRIEEYYGFEKWKELTLAFLEYQKKYPDQFYLVRYERLVEHPAEVISNAFAFCGLDLEKQVLDFIHASQSEHKPDAYSVYKSPEVKDQWRSQLNPRIYNAILSDLAGTQLETFLS